MSQDSTVLRRRQPGTPNPCSSVDTKSLTSQSSTSGYDHKLHDYPSQSVGIPNHAIKTFELHNTGFHLDLIVHDQDKRPLYYVNNSTWTSGVPDVVLCRDGEKAGATVAVAQFFCCSFSTKMQLALGDPHDLRSVRWEEMARVKGWSHSLYRFQVSLGTERRTFTWKRTRASQDGVRGVEHVSCMHYKLLEEGSQEVLAMYLDSGLSSWKKRGKIQIFADLGNDWETWVLISALSLLESNRRRLRHPCGGVYGSM